MLCKALLNESRQIMKTKQFNDILTKNREHFTKKIQKIHGPKSLKFFKDVLAKILDLKIKLF